MWKCCVFLEADIYMYIRRGGGGRREGEGEEEREGGREGGRREGRKEGGYSILRCSCSSLGGPWPRPVSGSGWRLCCCQWQPDTAWG